MWLYILSFFSREQSHGNKCKQRGPRVASYFPPVPLLSRGFHKHILLSLCILLSLSHSLSLFFFLFSHCHSVCLYESPLSRHWSFPPQCQCKRAPFCSNGPRLLKNGERWMAPHGKHTVSPESVFEGLPRSWVFTNRLKGILCGDALRELCQLNVRPNE